MISFDIEKSEERGEEILLYSKNTEEINLRINLAGYLKSAVYGGLDGIVTTFSIVLGAIGAGYDSNVVLIMGVANLVSKIKIKN
jgi:hypothetical protein